MVYLQPMTDEEISAFFPIEWERYRETLLETGMSEEGAQANIDMNIKALFPEGKLREGNYLFNVINNDQIVGELWIARQTGDSATYFIYDIEIGEEFRGQGLGRSTMEAGEEFVRQQGGTALELNVFWINEVARSLYLSLGYNFTSAHMRKSL